MIIDISSGIDRCQKTLLLLPITDASFQNRWLLDFVVIIGTSSNIDRCQKTLIAAQAASGLIVTRSICFWTVIFLLLIENFSQEIDNFCGISIKAIVDFVIIVIIVLLITYRSMSRSEFPNFPKPSFAPLVGIWFIEPSLDSGVSLLR